MIALSSITAEAVGHQRARAGTWHPGAAVTHQRLLERGLTIPVGVFMMAMNTEMGKLIF